MKGNSLDKPAPGQIISRYTNKFRLLFPLVLIFVVAAVACSSDSRDKAPDFSISMFQGEDAVGGKEVSLHSLVGSRPIVLNFWAGLCPPCRAEMPDLQEFSDEFEDRALLLGVDIGQFTGLGNPEDAKELLKELDVTYPAGSTSDRGVIQDYKVLGMPTTIFIDTEGNIFNKWVGALNGEVLREKTLEMLSQ